MEPREHCKRAARAGLGEASGRPPGGPPGTRPDVSDSECEAITPSNVTTLPHRRWALWSVIFSIFGMTTHLKEQTPTPVNLRDERINYIGEIRDKLRIKKEEKFEYEKKKHKNIKTWRVTWCVLKSLTITR